MGFLSKKNEETTKENHLVQEPVRARVEEQKSDEIKDGVNNKIVIVKELPVQPVRSYVEENGTKVTLMTIEEALTKIMNQ